MKKILIANIFGIGDVLFTTPLIMNLKKKYEGVSVDYLCNARTKDIVERVPDIDDIFVYEKDEITALWRSSKVDCLRKIRSLYSEIRKKKYDAVFDFTLSREIGAFFALAGIPSRIGFDYKNRGIFLTRKFPLAGFEKRHVIEYYLDLLSGMNVDITERHMQLVPYEHEVETARMRVNRACGEGSSLVAVIPGGGASWGNMASRKRWIEDGFVSVADKLSEEGFQIAVLGDPSEKEICSKMSGRMKTKPCIIENDLSIGEYTALLEQCSLVVCNDGGPLHISAALGVSTVSIFGPVDDKVYGPYPPGTNNKVIKAIEVSCRPCYNRFKLPDCNNDIKCIKDIDADEVYKACMELLNSVGS